MTLSYFDTSAAMKLLTAEAESEALRKILARDESRTVVASWLLHTELHCAAGRRPDHIAPQDVNEILQRVLLVDLDRGTLIAAGTHAPLRSNDAIHLAVAIRLSVDEMITYDRELADAASRAGIRVLSPGAS